jgi:hypothetical protein
MESEYTALAIGAVEGDTTVQNHTQRRGKQLSTEFVYRVEVSQPVASVDIKDIQVSVSWKAGRLNQARPASVRLQSSKGRLW